MNYEPRITRTVTATLTDGSTMVCESKHHAGPTHEAQARAMLNLLERTYLATNCQVRDGGPAIEMMQSGWPRREFGSEQLTAHTD
jgi:hypothetical protein